MRKYKDGDFIVCDKCGSIVEYNSKKIEKQYETHDELAYTVYHYINCPDCENLILFDKFKANNKID